MLRAIAFSHLTSALDCLTYLLEVAEQEVELFNEVVEFLSVLEYPEDFKWEREKRLCEAWVRRHKGSPDAGGRLMSDRTERDWEGNFS